jgi:lysophospholipase L1-like esterase
MHRARLGVHALLVAAVALLLQTVILQRRNTLEDNGRWASSKVGLEYGILGAVAFLTTRTALWLDRADLGSWHGYHELVRRDPVRLGRLDARVRLDGPGYAVMLFEKTAQRFQGVRVSSDPAFPAACLEGDAAGGFAARTPLDIPLLERDWHRLSVTRSGGVYRVSFDGRGVGTCGVASPFETRIGFRGSAADHVWVDDVAVWGTGQEQPWTEDFANRRHAGWIGIGAALGVGAVLGGVLLATARTRRREGLTATPYLFTTHLVLLVSALALWAVDTWVLWPRHPDEVDFRGYVTTFERKRDVVARLREEVAVPKPAGRNRLLFLGGSQTWGSGARTRADTWSAKLREELGPDVEVINAGIPAYTAPQLLRLYEDEWIDWEPDVVVLNVSHNDRDPEALETAVRRFVALNGERGIATVLVPEANSVENRSSLDALAERHARLRRVAAEEGLALVETHDWLAERRDAGFLWWDRVHLTPFGQTLLARRLAQQRDRLLKR